MKEIFLVEVGESVEDGLEHVASFVGRERALREDLREIFGSVFGDKIEKIHAGNFATAGIKDAEKIGMGELSGFAPARELAIGVGRAKLDELERAGLRGSLGELCEEDGAVICAAEKLLQRKFRVDDLADPLIR